MVDSSEQMQLADLLELVKGGASIKIDRPAQKIDQFDELIAEIKKMIVGQEARANADRERSKVQLEVLARLQSLSNKKPGVNRSPPVDFAPLQRVLTEILESNHREPADYDFKILRNGPGMSPAHTIQARVVRSTKY